jgi:lysophospholipase L1-like esterase
LTYKWNFPIFTASESNVLSKSNKSNGKSNQRTCRYTIQDLQSAGHENYHDGLSHGLSPVTNKSIYKRICFDGVCQVKYRSGYINRMRYTLAAIGLAPFLIAQGLYVRGVTPRLPEPPGERSGIHGSGSPLSLLILGDSAAAGVGVSAQSQALSGQLVSALGSDFQVSWKLIAQTGHTAKDVLAKIEMASPEKFDVVVTSIGVNDVTRGTMTKNWIEHQSKIIELLQSKFHAQYIILSSIPPMHLFPALPQPLRWYLGMRATRLNSALKNFIENCNRCELIKTNFPLEAAYMAADGFHPGALSYSVWANHVAVIIRSWIAATTVLKDEK